MSEEEISDRMILIINGYKECLDYNCNQTKERQREIKYDIETLEAMIDLYNKEKEKNKELEIKLELSKKLYDDACICLVDTISKDKIKQLHEKYIGQYLKFYEKIEELLEERN
jgi:hypothetical protein